MAGSCKEAGLVKIRALSLKLRSLKHFSCTLAVGYVGECDHHSFDTIVMGAIGENTSEEPGVMGCTDLAFDRGFVGEYLARIT